MEVLNLNRHHLGFLISVEQEPEVCPEVGWDPNSHVSSSKAYITISVSEPSVMETLD